MNQPYQMQRLDAVEITDDLFSHYVSLISDVVVPYQWEILNDRIAGTERSHCLDNFRIASGQKKGAFYGEVFQDSDVYKWLEALSYCLERGRALSFIPIADEVISLIASAQMEDGYLHTYHIINGIEKRWTNLLEAHELYCAGYLIESGIAYDHATGKSSLLTIAMRFADLICDTFGEEEGKRCGYSGHEEIELALIALYRYTGCQRYLDTASYFLSVRGTEPSYFQEEIRRRNGEGIYHEFKDYDLKYGQAHARPVEQKDAEGHAVRALYLYTAMADLAMVEGDEAYKKACIRLYQSITERRMYLTGGVGSSGYLERFTTDYDLPNDRAYCESCASVGLMMFSKRMAELNQDASYYDSVERALYNTVLSGISHDGMRYFYVNPLSVWPDACMESTSMAHVKSQRQPWFKVACCPTNIARTLASLGKYMVSVDKDSLLVNLFISSTITVERGNGPVQLHMDAEQSTRSDVHFTASGTLNLQIRIPGYVKHPHFICNGVAIQPAIVNHYAKITLRAGEELVFALNLQPRWVAAHQGVREDAYKVALMYGPFVYCLEEVDNQKNLATIGVDPNVVPSQVGNLDELSGAMPIFSYPAKTVVRRGDDLYDEASYTIGETKVRAVPYALWGNREKGEMLVFQHLSP
ncbi:MAG: glycoside hydrolase family 127 protein [Sphaerochaeta sp.]